MNSIAAMDAPKVFGKGDSVYVKSLGQTGKVKYVRFKAPNYNEPDAYSILLDSKLNDPYYSGSIFSADDVVKVA